MAEVLASALQGEEVLSCYFCGEDSDFIRFNRSQVRQAGHVTQQSISVNLIKDRRQAGVEVTLTGDAAGDRARLLSLVEELRGICAHVPEDPFLNYATEIRSSERMLPNRLPSVQDMVQQFLAAGRGRDLVGIHASGALHRGFANSLGQRNWETHHSFNLDWSLYLHADKAVKSRYAGCEWQDEVFARRVREMSLQSEILARPARTIPPGRYRVYLTPTAMEEILGLLSWGGFGLRDHRNGTTPLLRMIEQDARLNPAVTIMENNANGIAPSFQEQGFIRPQRIALIENGVYRNCLVSPRSAMEYGVVHNGADGAEVPSSLEMAPGSVPSDEVLRVLDTGLYIGNLWYLNYSDRNAGRLTGMTRFATFWVQNGQIEAPVNVMRFDDTVYHLLGEHLLGLTAEREVLLDPGSYGGRSTRSARLPGALLEHLNFTL